MTPTWQEPGGGCVPQRVSRVWTRTGAVKGKGKVGLAVAWSSAEAHATRQRAEDRSLLLGFVGMPDVRWVADSLAEGRQEQIARGTCMCHLPKAHHVARCWRGDGLQLDRGHLDRGLRLGLECRNEARCAIDSSAAWGGVWRARACGVAARDGKGGVPDCTSSSGLRGLHGASFSLWPVQFECPIVVKVAARHHLDSRGQPTRRSALAGLERGPGGGTYSYSKFVVLHQLGSFSVHLLMSPASLLMICDMSLCLFVACVVSLVISFLSVHPSILVSAR